MKLHVRKLRWQVYVHLSRMQPPGLQSVRVARFLFSREGLCGRFVDVLCVRVLSELYRSVSLASGRSYFVEHTLRDIDV